MQEIQLPAHCHVHGLYYLPLRDEPVLVVGLDTSQPTTPHRLYLLLSNVDMAIQMGHEPDVTYIGSVVLPGDERMPDTLQHGFLTGLRVRGDRVPEYFVEVTPIKTVA